MWDKKNDGAGCGTGDNGSQPFVFLNEIIFVLV